MQPEITTEVVKSEGATTIVVGGEIDMSNCEQLRAAIEPHLHAGEAVVLDLSAVQFVDSSAIRVMIQSRDRAVVEGASFALRDLSEPVRRVLTVAGVLDLFADSGAAS